MDVGQLQAALAAPSAMRAAARATGSAALHGTGADVAGWTIDAQTRLDALAPGRGRLPITGTITAQLDNRRYQVVADDTIASMPLQASCIGISSGSSFLLS